PRIPWQPGGPQSKARDLKALLTGERRTRKELDQSSTEILTTTAVWDPRNHNLVDVINMLTFHQATGGSEYTGMNNAAQRELESTHSMDLGRGILIGRVRAPAAQVRIDGAALPPARNETFVRFVLPVQHFDRAPAATIPKPGEKPSPP